MILVGVHKIKRAALVNWGVENSKHTKGQRNARQ